MIELNDKIFESYLQDKCPVCSKKVSMEDNRGITECNGKVMTKYFLCPHCFSEYTVGYNKSLMNISSEITRNTMKEKENKIMIDFDIDEVCSQYCKKVNCDDCDETKDPDNFGCQGQEDYVEMIYNSILKQRLEKLKGE